MSGDPVRLQSSTLTVTVAPELGGSITSIHTRDGEEILWQPQWPPAGRPRPEAVLEADQWLAQSQGGWQILLPNGGDAVELDGAAHGFHGQASIAAWSLAHRSAHACELRYDLSVLPLSVVRTITVEAETVTVAETVRNSGKRPVRFMWTHHPGIGGDVLAGQTRLTTNARHVQVDQRSAPVGIPIAAGAEGAWPIVDGHDLSMPVDGTHLLTYLSDFDGPPWVRLARTDDHLAARITWDHTSLPYCWLWEELGGSSAAPWHGRERVIGIEPSNARLGQGLEAAVEANTVTQLEAGETTATWVSLTIDHSDRATTHSRTTRSTAP